MTKQTPTERFVTIEQCRMPSGRKLNIPHLARIITFEAMQSNRNLRDYLTEIVLFGNCGSMTLEEMRALGDELFVGQRSAEYLGQLRNDNCLGFAPEEEEVIIRAISLQRFSDLTVALMLGYRPPPMRR